MNRTRRSTPDASIPTTYLVFSVAFLSFLTVSCTPDASRGSTATVTDSAGVAIVENSGPPPPDGGGWAVSPEPSLSIGTLEGEEVYQFFGVAGIHRFSDGRIGVANVGSRSVRIFAADGTHLQSFGQQGGGPEEFEMPLLAGAIGDTLVVTDRAHHRLSLVHPDLGFVGLAPIPFT